MDKFRRYTHGQESSEKMKGNDKDFGGNLNQERFIAGGDYCRGSIVSPELS